MKQINKYLSTTMIVVFFHSVSAMAQWTTSPDAPLEISNYSYNQTSPQLISDGDEGYFIFWLDNRNINVAIYGQHLNKYGVALWEENGRSIIEDTAFNYSHVQALLNSDGDVIIGWQSGLPGGYEDTLYVAKLNSDGEQLWPAAAKVAGRDLLEGGTYFGPGEFSMLEIDNNYYFGIIMSGYGYNFECINKVANDGTVLWGYNGYKLPDNMNGSSIKLVPDGAGGCFIKWDYYHNYLQHFDQDGNLLWGTPKDVTNCTTGTGGSYAGFPYFLIEADGSGGIMAAWSSLSDDIYASHIDFDGLPVFDDECTPINLNPYSQEEISFSKSGDDYYVGWVDSRPDSTGIYMQKFNQAGELQWAEELYVEDTSFYIPVIKSVTTSEGDIAIFYQAAGNFYAQKIHPDGTTEWEQPIIVLASYYQPFYTHYELHATDDGNVIGVSEALSISGDQNIYAFNLNFASGDTIVEDTATTAILSVNEQLKLYPNPADQFVQIEESTHLEILLELYDLNGKLLINYDFTGSGKIDLSEIKNGIYFIHMKYAGGDEIRKLIVMHNSGY